MNFNDKLSLPLENVIDIACQCFIIHCALRDWSLITGRGEGLQNGRGGGGM